MFSLDDHAMWGRTSKQSPTLPNRFDSYCSTTCGPRRAHWDCSVRYARPIPQFSDSPAFPLPGWRF